MPVLIGDQTCKVQRSVILGKVFEVGFEQLFRFLKTGRRYTVSVPSVKKDC